MNKFSTQVLPCNFKTCTAYSGTKLNSKFQLKDQTKKDHQDDVVYYVKCPEEHRRLHRRNKQTSYRTCERSQWQRFKVPFI